MTRDVYFITGNSKKFNEVKSNLVGDIELIQHDLDTPEIQTTSLEEISKDKALKAFEELRKPLIVDDSGTFFDHYYEFPGAMAKHMFKSLGFEGFKNLLAEKSSSNAGRMATVITYMDETLSEPIQFRGDVEGEFSFDFLEEFEDDFVMPYNHIFIPKGWSRPVQADYKKFIKDSQRARAVRKLNEFLSKNI